MKLSQIYSNKETFKSLSFKDGFNVILGKVMKKYDLSKDSHNLGKTTLITVIDFLLLKEISKNHIFSKFENKFSGHILFLEILLNTGKYLTIRRSIDTNTKISFKESSISSILIDEENWDFNNISLKKAVKQLNDYLSFDVLQNWDYRKSVSYFLRTQKDYNDVFQLNKFEKGKDVFWKPFMFDLLGFTGNLLVQKYDSESEKDTLEEFICKTKKKFEVSPEDIDKIKGNILLKKSKSETLQNKINDFNFYQQERNLNKELITEIEQNISQLNSLEYAKTYELDKARNSIKKALFFDIQQLKSLYSEFQVLLPDSLIKSYEELEEFNKKITEERNKYLNELIQKLDVEIRDIREKLEIQNNKRVKILSVLRDKDSFRKFKEYQVELTQIEGEIVRLEEQLKSIDKIGALKEKIKDLTENIDELVSKVKTQINDGNTRYTDIRTALSNIYSYIFNAEAIIYVAINKANNVEFKYEIRNDNESTAQAEGNSYLKMLCVSFDISILLSYNNQSFYRFVYHDGCFEALDNRKKIRFVNLIRDYCNKYNIQYIMTAIEDDIPSEIKLSSEEIRLELTDDGDTGRLFGFSF